MFQLVFMFGNMLWCCGDRQRILCVQMCPWVIPKSQRPNDNLGWFCWENLQETLLVAINELRLSCRFPPKPILGHIQWFGNQQNGGYESKHTMNDK